MRLCEKANTKKRKRGAGPGYDDNSDDPRCWSPDGVKQWFVDYKGGTYRHLHQGFAQIDGQQIGLMTEVQLTSRCQGTAADFILNAWKEMVGAGES